MMQMRVRFEPSLWIEHHGQQLHLGELARVLAEVPAARTLQAVARQIGLSYRTVWNRLVAAERVLGVPLVARTKGHGTALTEAGAALLAQVRRAEHAAQSAAAEPVANLAAHLRGLGGRLAARLRLHASHDPLIQRCAAEPAFAELDVSFVGSAQAVEALAGARAELAGFHLPEGRAPGPPFAALFEDDRLFVRPVMRREQGIVVARGNPLGIRRVADLARPEVRFINRQRGAGTRAWLDELLSAQGIASAAVRGYDHEEFTHFAVAAAVAAGAADAGLALRAAARELGLGFVPLGVEVYSVAGARTLEGDPLVRALLARLRVLAGSTPGYAMAPRRRAGEGPRSRATVARAPDALNPPSARG